MAGNNLNGFSVSMFFPSGDPRALQIVERMNSIVKVICFPKSNLDGCKAHLDRVGAYLLLGEPEEGKALPIAYIGEADPVSDRLKNHARDPEKLWWERT